MLIPYSEEVRENNSRFKYIEFILTVLKFLFTVRKFNKKVVEYKCTIVYNITIS